MKFKSGLFSVLVAAVLGAVVVVLCPARVEASEIAATHLVYEKAAKMKKVDAFLFLPFFDQSRKSDSPQRDRMVHCAVSAEGKRGSLTISGRFRLRLLGETKGSATPWESRALLGPVDDVGEASFESGDIHELVDAASGAGASVELFGIEFDGGKGGKVTVLTMDCLHQGDDS